MIEPEPVLPTALAWQRHDCGVFPLHWPVTHNGQTLCSCGRLCGRQAAKHPYAVRGFAPHGCLDATLQPGIAKLWWGLRIPDANLGVATERLIVIDTDPRHGGDESLKKLKAEHGELPLTWRSLTGGGGTHDIYKAPDGVKISNVVAEQMKDPPLGPGIDIRARGGYIVSPPSRHISGGVYAWSVDHHPAHVELAPAPDWLIERLTTARGTNPGKGHDPATWAAWAAAIHSDYRDAAVARMAGKLLRAVSLDPDYVLILLLAWNRSHCDPPLPDDEVREIFDRICKREIKRAEAN
jgi:Bifunctional DNA primase/polymerase, N-terminal